MARPALISPMAHGRARIEPVAITPARFDLYYAELRGPLRAYLRRIVKNAALADDLFQETWIRLLTHPPHTLDSAGVRAYVFTIATHLARDAWRRETWIGRFLRAPRETAREPDSHAQLEAREDVERCFGTLTERERAILWLAHVEQYDHREIAAMLGIRAASVRVLLHRARRRAQAALRGPEKNEGGPA